MIVDAPPARTIPRRRPGVPNPSKWSRRVFGALGVMVAAWLLLTLVPGRQPLVVDIAPPRQPAGTPRLAWLATDRNAIVDDQGRAVLLRGFNTAALLHWPRQPVAPLDDMDLELMRGAGFDVVRLPIAWSKLEPERGRIDAAYLDDIDRTVRQINDHDLYVVLDMHMTLGWSPRFGGAGAPDWATLPFIPHVAFAAPGEWAEMLSPAVAAATDYFWLSPDWQNDLSDTWRAVAARFSDRSGVIGYDLFNVPTALIPPGYFERGLVWPLYARLMADIDQVDSHHLFFIEGPYIADFAPSIRPLSAASRVVYSPHLYTGSQVAPLFPQDPAATPRRINQQMGDASQVPAPAWWGELGIVMDKPYATAWAEAALDTFDDLQVGWAWWQWRQDWNWGVRDGDGDTVNQVFLGHLARPFVVATPRGVQVSRGASGRGSLTLTVQTSHQHAPVVVSWPTLLPEPTVVGDCVERWTRDAQAARIELWLVPAQACTVQVESAS